ncbi:MAG: cobalt-precorrin-6A reductase [Proteobacteria bacterium]|nr:cobalt-precorrin-6A reductase [Pseudomonadota bacterium]
MRILILGGTTEASELAKLVADDERFDATLSLAGRTMKPRPQPIATRSGGFGGAEALAHWLRDEKIEAVVDATHPYADKMSANAAFACGQAGVPLASIVRPPWTAVPGDIWQSVASADAAAQAIGARPHRVFLSLGRQELGAFAAAPQHRYLGRSVDEPRGVALPPDIRMLLARGPFTVDAETTLLRDEKIEVLVSKNSGGTAIYAKIAAARTLGIRVLMIARPDKAMGHPIASPQEAIDWLRHAPPRSLRGV